jgi:hypothetical protein
MRSSPKKVYILNDANNNKQIIGVKALAFTQFSRPDFSGPNLVNVQAQGGRAPPAKNACLNWMWYTGFERLPNLQAKKKVK